MSELGADRMAANQRHRFPSVQFGALQLSGVSSETGSGDTLKLRIERMEVRDVKLETPLGSASAALVALTNVTADLRTAPQPGPPLERLAGFTIGELRLQGATVEQVIMPPLSAARSRAGWRLDPLGSLAGTVHADITDAAWVFDADVTIPIAEGRIDFNRATVEHIGPDSSMGISRMGVYVDAPNGRTYLYLLSATHVPGAKFERRSARLGSWTTDRGSIELQPFVECFLSGMPLGALATGTRAMMARTRVSAALRPGDGVIGSEGSRLVLAGRAQGKNTVELSSPSGVGVVVRVPELSVVESRCKLARGVVSTGAMAATLSVQLKDFPAMFPASASIAEMTIRDVVFSPDQNA